jgi:VWFA-related protein
MVSATIAVHPWHQTAVSQTDQRPTFRAGTAAVAVDVSVQVRNKPERGLALEDFQLLDNGVAQRIESLSTEAIPLDVSILLDVSGSVRGWVQQLEQNATQIARLLNSRDRFRVVCFGSDVREVLPMSSPHESPRLKSLPYTGGTSIRDALFLTMVHAPGPDRRHLIVVYSDGQDTTSVLTADQLVDAGRRTESSVHLVRVDPNYGNSVLLGRGPTVGHPVPPELERLVESSGGEMYRPLSASMPAALERLLTDYRMRYLLSYTPVGVAADGWHNIEVRVPTIPNATIKARKGYSAEAPR